MFKTILVAIDGSGASRRALETAIDLAQDHDARLYIAHIHLRGRPTEELERLAEIEHLVPEVATNFAPSAGTDATRHRDRLSKDQHQVEAATEIGDMILLRAKEQALESGVERVEAYSASGDYADGILDAIDETGADLIVMGRRGLGRLKSTLLGSVSNKVVQQAGSAVLLVQ